MEPEGVKTEMQYGYQVAHQMCDLADYEVAQAQEVGVVELSTEQLHDPERHEKLKEAHEREIKQMTARRFVREGTDRAKKFKNFIPTSELPEQYKKGAQKCRLSYTTKRPSEEQLLAGEIEGKHKARLVAMDLKKRNPKDKLDVYAAVPPMEVIRLILASYRHETEEMSSTDLDVAYLQAHKWANKLILICYWDMFKKEWIYEWIDGVIYGM